MSEEIKDAKTPYGFPKIREWIQAYGRPDIPDQRGVQDLMECETSEVVRALQAELMMVTAGKFDAANFDKAIGTRRRAKHDSYENWAKLMLQWIASYKG